MKRTFGGAIAADSLSDSMLEETVLALLSDSTASSCRSAALSRRRCAAFSEYRDRPSFTAIGPNLVAPGEQRGEGIYTSKTD